MSLTPAQDSALRDAIRRAVATVPGHHPGPLMTPLMRELGPAVEALLVGGASSLAPAVAPTGASGVESGDQTRPAGPVGSVHGESFEVGPGDRLGVAAVAADGTRTTIIQAADNHDIAADALTRPADYVADLNAFRVELWMTPDGWNEGHESTYQPMLTFFVTDRAHVEQIRAAIARHRHRHAWTGFEVRFDFASSRAKMTDPARVIAQMQEWIAGPDPEKYIP